MSLTSLSTLTTSAHIFMPLPVYLPEPLIALSLCLTPLYLPGSPIPLSLCLSPLYLPGSPIPLSLCLSPVYELVHQSLCFISYQSIYLGYLWVSLLIGLPGNILIAVVYVVVRHKRTCDWFIFYLSVYDCAVCLFAVPLYLSIETGVWASTGSDLACKVEQFTIFTSQFSSVLILGIIAVDR